jgi:hypothetical protein
MGTPGSGRYTTYLPVKSSKTERLLKLFKNGLSALYNGKESNADAAAEAVAVAKKVLDGKGDQDVFGSGVDLTYGANSPEIPNDTTAVKWQAAGDPANPYVPDITSPGPGKTDGSDKDVDPTISPEDIKPNFDSKNPSVNTTSPSATSKRLGTLSLGENLQGGKSSVE